jgi:hypothetical protein
LDAAASEIPLLKGRVALAIMDGALIDVAGLMLVKILTHV